MSLKTMVEKAVIESLMVGLRCSSWGCFISFCPCWVTSWVWVGRVPAVVVVMAGRRVILVAALPVTVGAATQTAAQMAVVAPTTASGLALSALASLDTAGAPTLPLFLPDDGNIQVSLGASPLCHAGVTFYGTVYTDLFVNSNGDVSFTTGHNSFTSSAAAWQTLMPRIGFHTDWEPNNFGTVDVTVVGPTLQVNFTNMSEWGTAGANTTSYTVEFGGGLAPVALTNFVTTGGWGATPVVGGISLGASGTHPPLVSFDTLNGLGLQANPNATDSVIDENLTGMLANTTGWTSILFPLGDGSSYIVN